MLFILGVLICIEKTFIIHAGKIILSITKYAGNQVIHALSTSESQELRVELEDFQGNQAYATYTNFSIGPESDNFRLRVSGYSGNVSKYLRDECLLTLG